ncbi:MAG: sensor histidine kinase [Candidatus Zixiibacteriota bacterium]
MPFIEIGIVLAFLIVALIGFQNIKRSEERHIWVGMAKETAHQLGTPISSLMGWLEMIEGDSGENSAPITAEEFKDAVDNMKVDVRRLQRVANRFGLIGSRPELKPYDLNNLIAETVEYYRRRLPFEGKGITISFSPADLPQIPLNAELLGWALENLIKNALQAVDSKSGKVEVRSLMDSDKKQAIVEIIDNGMGIPAGAARKIFRPGFTTKKRGWGLGLTLVIRIVKEYHGGLIYLKKSKPGETIFELNLPAA